MRTLILDNGSYSIKVGWSTDTECFHVQNAMMRSRDRRLWLGNAVNACKDLTGLQYRRPIDRGQLYSWDLEKAIWDWTWDSKKVVDSVDEFKDCALLLTENPGSLPSSSTNTDQIVFEEYEFAKYRRVLPQVLAAGCNGPASQGKLVVDVGFSSTYIVPVLDNVNAVAAGTKRAGISGKLLTNYLKETISYRYYNMMEESAIMGRIKEDTCFVSADFACDLGIWKKCRSAKQHSPFAKAYALPSTQEDPFGHVLEPLEAALEAQKTGDQQILLLENERFSVPEALFDPKGHVGLDQAGIPELVAQSIAACPPEYQPLLWANIVVCGGSSSFAGFSDRLGVELRKWAPSEVPLQIQLSSNGNNIEAAWQGGKNITNDNLVDVESWAISREEYLEQGPAQISKRFAQSNRWKP